MADKQNSEITFIADIIISIVLAMSILYTLILKEKTKKLLNGKARVTIEKLQETEGYD